MRHQPGILPRGMRRLTIRGETWGWRFGDVVPIIAPDGQRFKIGIRELTGMSWNDIERGTHKKYFKVEPRLIVDHINRQILGYSDAKSFPAGIIPVDWCQTLDAGWQGIQGPRGLWQWKSDPFCAQIRSPEDVLHDARMYHLLDMTAGEWFDAKAAAIVASGSTVDDEIRNGREKHGFGLGHLGYLYWEGPGLPVPTQGQILAHIERRVTGMPEKSPA